MFKSVQKIQHLFKRWLSAQTREIVRCKCTAKISILWIGSYHVHIHTAKDVWGTHSHSVCVCVWFHQSRLHCFFDHCSSTRLPINHRVLLPRCYRSSFSASFSHPALPIGHLVPLVYHPFPWILWLVGDMSPWAVCQSLLLRSQLVA